MPFNKCSVNTITWARPALIHPAQVLDRKQRDQLYLHSDSAFSYVLSNNEIIGKEAEANKTAGIMSFYFRNH